jgi:hypothetical protein
MIHGQESYYTLQLGRLFVQDDSIHKPHRNHTFKPLYHDTAPFGPNDCSILKSLSEHVLRNSYIYAVSCENTEYGYLKT